jgi:hypothetical protein
MIPVSLWSLALLPVCIDEATNGAGQKAIVSGYRDLRERLWMPFPACV